jgi:hypothetical protein
MIQSTEMTETAIQSTLLLSLLMLNGCEVYSPTSAAATKTVLDKRCRVELAASSFEHDVERRRSTIHGYQLL